MASNGINYKPVGIFWDIENCSVPKNKSACAVIAHIRNFFVVNRLNHREYEFLIACDVSRIRKDVPDDVNRAGGVTLAHVSGASKNAADEKLRENMKRFVDTHTKHDGTSPVLILVSGDIDFVNDLRGYQMRMGCTIVLVHAINCSPQFKIGWNEIYSFQDFCAAVPLNPTVPAANIEQGKPNAGNKQPKQGGPGPKQGGPGPKQQGPKPQQQGGPGPKQQGPAGPKQQGPGGPKQQKQQGPQNGQFQQGPNDGQNQQGIPNGRIHHGSGGNTKGPKQPNEQQLGAGPPNQNQPKQKKGPENQSGNNQQGQGQQGQNPGKKKGPPGQQQQQHQQGNNPPTEQMAQMNIQGPGQDKKPKPDVPKFILMVSGLPGKMDFHILKDHLQEQANIVHGKVKYVKNGQAFISFNHKANADRAVALFNGKDVYGKSLNVTFVQKIPFENPIDKKLKGGTAPDNFVMVNHGDVSGAPGGKNPKNKKNGDGGYQGQAPGNPQGQNVVGMAQRQQQQAAPTNWQETMMTDPSIVGHLGTFAGAVIREYTLNSSGASANNGRRGQNQGPSEKKEACSIQ